MGTSLVTGGCGFLGSAIVRALLERGDAVRVLMLPGEPTENVEGLPITVVEGDILDPDACRRAMRGVRAVFHAAALYRAWVPDPTRMYAVALDGTFHVLQAALRAGVERAVVTASIVSLGRPPEGQLADEDTPYEAWGLDFSYSRSKYFSRRLAEDFAAWGLDVRVVCPGVVLGPGDVAPTPSGRLLLELARGGARPYTHGGSSYVDVRDAARVHVLAEERGQAGRRYVATAHNLDNLSLLRAITHVLGVERRLVEVPVPMARTLVRALDFAARRTGREPALSREFFEYSLRPAYFRNDRSVSELGMTYRPLEETLRDALDWFRARGQLPDAG